jgi:hypothetical protein
MDCSDVERALLAGEPLLGKPFEEHLAGCASCRFLTSDGAGVAQALAESGGPPPVVDLGALEQGLAQRLDRERGPLAAGRALPRVARFALVAAVMALGALGYFALIGRRDFAVYPAARMALILGGYAAFALGLTWAALRPLYLPPLPDLVARALVAVGLLVPVGVALLPEVPMAVTLPDFNHARSAVGCFTLGGALALAVLLAARALDRGGGRATLFALGAGIIGVLGLQLHCPINYPLHLLLGHATVPLAFALVAVLPRRRPA